MQELKATLKSGEKKYLLLPATLKCIRQTLHLSQRKMAIFLNAGDSSRISKWEKGLLEPDYVIVSHAFIEVDFTL